MKQTLLKLREYIQNGFLYSFGASVVNKIVSFVSGVIIVRILTQSDYGLLGISTNIFSIAVLFAGFGISSGLLQFCAEKREENEKRGIYKYTNSIGIITCLFLAIVMYYYAEFNINHVEESAIYIKFSSLLPLFYFLYNNETLYLRAYKRIKEYTRVLNAKTILYALFSVLFGLYYGIAGVIAGRYLAYILSFFIGYHYIKINPISFKYRQLVAKQLKREIWSFSIMSGVASAINQLVYLIDINMITTMLQDSSLVAIYKVATLIPESLNIIPSSLFVVVIPYFALHLGDKEWVSSNTKKIIGLLGLVNFVIVSILLIFAPLIITVLWKEEYLDAVTPFRILSINYFFLGTFRLTSTQILASQRNAKANMLISIATLFSNIIFDFVFIQIWGINGAALATLAVVLVSCILQIPEMYKVLKPVDCLKD